MSDNESASSGSAYYPYVRTGSGTNDQGNNWDTRIQPAGHAYHYSNSDGSYYYANANGSTYFNNGNGASTYTSPSGFMVRKWQ